MAQETREQMQREAVAKIAEVHLQSDEAIAACKGASKMQIMKLKKSCGQLEKAKDAALNQVKVLQDELQQLQKEKTAGVPVDPSSPERIITEQPLAVWALIKGLKLMLVALSYLHSMRVNHTKYSMARFLMQQRI